MHSAVYINILSTSASMLNKLVGFLIAIAHIALNGCVIRILTLLYGDLYNITF